MTSPRPTRTLLFVAAAILVTTTLACDAGTGAAGADEPLPLDAARADEIGRGEPIDTGGGDPGTGDVSAIDVHDSGPRDAIDDPPRDAVADEPDADEPDPDDATSRDTDDIDTAGADTGPRDGGDSGGDEDAAHDVSTDDGDTAERDPADDTTVEIPAKCVALADGLNEGFDVDGVPRRFVLRTPRAVETDGPWPVVFAWHGFGETTEDIEPLLADQVDGPWYRFVLVVPDDLGLPLPLAADWDNIILTDGSIEARMFDEILACLDARFGIDRDRVHSVGFSSGAITTNSLAVVRGARMASIASLSGAYWSNPLNANTLARWPDLATSNHFVELIVYGGLGDTAFGFNFALTAANDIPYLTARGHDVIACDHGGGHRLPARPGGAEIAAFFAAHPRGTATSPWAAGLPPTYPVTCLYAPGTR